MLYVNPKYLGFNEWPDSREKVIDIRKLRDRDFRFRALNLLVMSRCNIDDKAGIGGLPALSLINWLCDRLLLRNLEELYNI